MKANIQAQTETTMHPKVDSHHQPNNISTTKDNHHIYDDHQDNHDQDNNHHKEKDDESIRAEHKRVAMEFQRVLQERQRKNKAEMNLALDRAYDAAYDGDKFCASFQATITDQDELYSRRVHKFYKIQDYYQQKRDDFFAKHAKWVSDNGNIAVLRAFTERVVSYLANVDTCSVEEDALEFDALLKAHEEIIPLRREKDAAWAELEAHANRFTQTVQQLIGWQIERHHYMPKRADDVAYTLVCQSTSMKLYHYR
jgi:hypothetical protein